MISTFSTAFTNKEQKFISPDSTNPEYIFPPPEANKAVPQQEKQFCPSGGWERHLFSDFSVQKDQQILN